MNEKNQKNKKIILTKEDWKESVLGESVLDRELTLC